MAVTIEQVEKAFNEFQKEHNNNIPIKAIIVDKQEDYYGEEHSEERTGIRIYGEYLAASKQVILVAASHNDNKPINSTIRHELNGHYAINTF